MKILLKIFPQKSHYNATFGLAHALKEAGHEVVYAGIPQMRGHVEAQGFAYFEEDDGIFPYNDGHAQSPTLSFWSLVRNWRAMHSTRGITKAVFSRGSFFDALLKNTKPNLFLVDSPYTFFALTLFRHKVPFAMLESMMNLNRASNLPPMDTTYVPTDSAISRLICALHWQRYFIKRWLLSRIGFRIDLNERFVRECARKWKVDISAVSFDRYFHLGLTNIPEILLSPRHLDFPRTLEPNQHYFSRECPVKRSETSSDYRFPQILEKFKAARLRDRPLIYCSLGTACKRYVGAARFFIQVALACRNKDWNLIIAMNDLFGEVAIPEGDNIEVFQTVPQLELLPNADLMITHGGMNSIAECAEYQVPMLVCPGTDEIDQAGNAARVVYHKLGIKGTLRIDSADKIAKQIELNFTRSRKIQQQYSNSKAAPTECNNIIANVLPIRWEHFP
ncbi:MAG: glycosyltransferase [Opitutaceae bacterium]|nr:glycosyltransferase [Opitutaceae bacterium]